MICCKACPIAIVILLMLNKQGTFHHTLFVFPNLNIVLMYVSFLFSPFARRSLVVSIIELDMPSSGIIRAVVEFV